MLKCNKQEKKKYLFFLNTFFIKADKHFLHCLHILLFQKCSFLNCFTCQLIFIVTEVLVVLKKRSIYKMFFQ